MMGFESAVIIILTALGLMLALVGIVLAAVALFIGFLAFWGFGEMKGYVKGAAERHVDETLAETLSSKFAILEEPIKRLIQKQLGQFGVGEPNKIETPEENALQQDRGVVAPPYPAQEPPHADDGHDATS